MMNDETYIITGHELAYLFREFDSPGMSLARRHLGFDGLDVSNEVVAAGAATLAARGMLLVEDEVGFPTGAADLVAATFAACTRWVDLGLGGSAAMSYLLMVESPVTRLLLAPQAFGNYEVGVITDDRSASARIWSFIEDARADDAVNALMVKARNADQCLKIVASRVDGSDWRTSRIVDDAATAFDLEPLADFAELRGRVEAMLDERVVRG